MIKITVLLGVELISQPKGEDDREQSGKKKSGHKRSNGREKERILELAWPRYEDISGSGGKAPDILHLGTRWRQAVSFTLWLLKTLGMIGSLRKSESKVLHISCCLPMWIRGVI
jgi:hypothetical protein